MFKKIVLLSLSLVSLNSFSASTQVTGNGACTVSNCNMFGCEDLEFSQNTKACKAQAKAIAKENAEIKCSKMNGSLSTSFFKVSKDVKCQYGGTKEKIVSIVCEATYTSTCSK